MKAPGADTKASDARDLRQWIQARELANRLGEESMASRKLSPQEAIGAAFGLMELASRFRDPANAWDAVRQRDEQLTRDAWTLLRTRYRLARQ